MHTPGPWTLTKRQGKLYVLTDPESQPFVGQIIAGQTTAPEYRDNLRLIAAAPALLEALEELVAEWDAGNIGRIAKIEGGRMRDDSTGIAWARNAIAAARGEGVTA